MLNQAEFTKKIIILLQAMIDAEETPMIHYVFRGLEEQNRLFREGKSKCDGYNIKSAHQKSCAMDIYFVENGKLIDPKLGWEYWHEWWEKMGGQKMIKWDKMHFEG